MNPYIITSDAAGKTTLLYKLKDFGRLFQRDVTTVIPTIGFNVEELSFHELKMTCWDVGGCSKIRHLILPFVTN